MAIKRHSHVYQAGPTFPDAVGDRYYAQDLFRDQNFIIDDAGRKIAAGYDSFPVLIKDSAMTKGTNWDDLDIPVAKGIVEFEVDVPNSYAALPPTVTQEDIYCRIETTAETDFDISGATLDGVTVNYVKVTYNETDGSSRARAKKAGSYVYEKAVSYTITVSSAAPTNKDLVLGTVVGDGATFLTIVSYPRTRHLNAAFDYVVSSQEEFNVIIDRTAANQYRIKDNIKSVYVKYLSGGYQMTGATSPWQGGDTYGYIETNDCTKIIFEPGAEIDMANERGYIEVDTDDCVLENVNVIGTGTVASAIQRSFLLNANRVLYNNCKTHTRLSNVDFVGFEGSSTAMHNYTSKYNNCVVYTLDGSDKLYGFKDCYNLNSCTVYDLDATTDICYGYSGCYYLTNCYVYDIENTAATYAIGFYECENISVCGAVQIDSPFAIGFYLCNIISSCRAEDIDGTTGVAYGFTECDIITSCYAYDIESTSGDAAGFQQCDIVSSCYANQIDADSGDAYGFWICKYMSGCRAEDIDSASGIANGYNACQYGSSFFTTEAANANNDWIDSVDAQITNKVSTPSVFT